MKTAARYPALLSAVCLCLLGACDGSDGPPGPTGPEGPQGPPSPPIRDVAEADSIVATILGASLGESSSLEFALADGRGYPLTGLPANAISFKLAKLVPGTDGDPSSWRSYINTIEQPGVGPGAEAKAQASTENGARGELIDNGDGTYRYTFALDVTNVTQPVPVEFAPTLSHRVSFEIRGFAAVRNPVFDVRPSDGATSGLFTRDIVATTTCNGCHGNLALHGGARMEVRDCVVCHNPGSSDANSGNTVNMTVMIHRIHRGADLPSVVAGGDYCIYGFRDSLHCFGDVVYPQRIGNCESCHRPGEAAAPDSANWYQRPSDTACGACHDDVDFSTGINHGPGIPASNSECATCHAADPASGIEIRRVHASPALDRRTNFSFNILHVDFAGPGTAPVVTFSVTDPANANTPYDLENDPELSASSLRFLLGWDTVDYTNAGNMQANAQPERTDVYSGGTFAATNNGDFTYSLTLGTVAATATGSGVIVFEGRVNTADGSVPVKTAHRYFAITDDPASPQPRRQVVDVNRCNACHDFVTFHGNNRNDTIEACQVCHNADATRAGAAGPMDIKHFIHRKHARDPIRYPQAINNCLACHWEDAYYPVASDSGVLATSFTAGISDLDPGDNVRTSANSAVCSVCHAGADARAHMVQAGGGSFDACQEADGTLRQRVDVCGPGGDKSGALIAESCSVCHGPDRIADVAASHGLRLQESQ